MEANGGTCKLVLNKQFHYSGSVRVLCTVSQVVTVRLLQKGKTSDTSNYGPFWKPLLHNQTTIWAVIVIKFK